MCIGSPAGLLSAPVLFAQYALTSPQCCFVRNISAQAAAIIVLQVVPSTIFGSDQNVTIRRVIYIQYAQQHEALTEALTDSLL
jgi:hypothetical protein